jgi:hypothetical protein
MSMKATASLISSNKSCGVSRPRYCSAVQKVFIRLALAFALAATLIHPQCTRATSVLAPDFDTLVRRAELIFSGRVTSQRAEWRKIDGQRSIVTLVTFEVLNVHKGSAARAVELQFLGGKIGDAELEVDLMPRFSTGERAVLFVEKNGAQASPLVGFCHGKFGVRSDESVVTYNGAPFGDVKEIGRRQAQRDLARTMSHAAFAERIRAAAQKGNP